MKAVITIPVTIAASLVGALASATPALAAENFHGNICHAQESGQANRFRHPGVGIEALSTGSIVCPLHTNGRAVSAIEVNVRVRTITQATVCAITPVNWDGNQKASIVLLIPPGELYKIATIPEIAKGNYVAYSVGCTLPQGQVLTSINVSP